MAKWHGIVGYAIPTQKSPGVWKDEYVERNYTGDVIRNTSRWSSNPESTNDNLTLNNQISIVADQFAYQNFRSIKYVSFMGAKWKVTSAEASHPRLLLTIGGVYNG